MYSPTLEFDYPFMIYFEGMITNFFVNIVVNANEVRILRSLFAASYLIFS